MTSNLVPPPWYGTTAETADISPEVAEQAVEWLMTLQSEPVSPQVIEQWQQWRACHPDHERAWQRIEAVRHHLQPLCAPGPVAVTQATLTQAAGEAKRSRQRRRVVKAMALLVFAGGTGYAVERQMSWRARTADYRTLVGEVQNLTLEDGTQVALNTASAMDVLFDATQRRLRLIAGEVLIRTAKSPDAAQRPFLVETAQGTARALGTWYAVRQQDARTMVSVFQGAVQVRLRQQPQSMLTVPAGHQVFLTDTQISALAPADDGQIAWRDGVIEARGMRLDDFLAELNRYSDDTLLCDPAIAGLRVSGAFPVRDVDMVLESLAATLGVRVERVTRFWGARRIRLASPAEEA